MNKSLIFILTLSILLLSYSSYAQCSICTKTAEQLGEGPAKDLNVGILYLAFTPFVIVAVIAYSWYRHQKKSNPSL